jgi:hypothetical protein
VVNSYMANTKVFCHFLCSFAFLVFEMLPVFVL